MGVRLPDVPPVDLLRTLVRQQAGRDAPGGRAVLADNLHALATAESGGHLHIDYFPGHWYLGEGSVPLVVNSPHGGMPSR